MKAALVGEPGRVSVVEVPKPSPKEGEILVRMVCCGVCGTDLEKVHGAGITSKALGHEVVGEVAEVGTGVSGFRPGQRVFTHHHVPCHACDLCSRGKYTYCAQYSKTNLVPCGLAEYYVVPRYNVERGAVLELPGTLSYEEASFIEPLACCILGLKEAGARGASTALVYGSGPVGLMHLKLLKLFGLRSVVVTDVSPYRLEFARRAGADATFNASEPREREEALRAIGGPELAVVATGSKLAFEDALRTVARTGSVLLFGVPTKGTLTTFDLAQYFLSGVKITTSYAASEEETAAALDLLARGQVKVSDMVTHRFSLERSDEAFTVASQQRCLKALIMP